MPTARSRSLWLGLALVGLTVLAYWPGMRAGFYFDDRRNIERATALHWTELSAESLRVTLDEAELPSRPVANTSFALNHLLGGLRPRGYHLTNLGIHLAMGAALVWLYRLLLLPAATGRGGPDDRRLAIALAGIFLLHPLNIQAVTYVVQRMTSLAALFGVLSLASWVTARNRVGSGRLPWFASAILCWLLAFGSKENALVLPPIVLLYEGCYRRPEWRRALRALGSRRKAVVGGLLGGLAGLGLWAVATSPRIRWLETFPNRDFSGLERLLTQARVHALYLSQWIWPSPDRLTIDHEFAVSRSLVDPWTTLPAVAGAVLGLAGTLWLLRRHPISGFAVGAYVVAHAIESAPISLELVFEHRMYLPMVFLLLAVGVAMARLPEAPASRATVCLLVLWLPLAAATYARNLTWGDTVAFHEDTARKAPSKFRPWYNLGTELGARGDLEGAGRAMRHALEIEPDDSRTLNQLGNVHLGLGEATRALDYYQRAVANGPGNPEARYNLGMVLDGFGRTEEAVEQYRAFLEIAPPALAPVRARVESRLGELTAPP